MFTRAGVLLLYLAVVANSAPSSAASAASAASAIAGVMPQKRATNHHHHHHHGKGSFPSSQLITAEHGTKLNSWANMSAGQEWELCYTSFTMDKTPAEFHKRCDEYWPTITVAHTYNKTQTGKCEGFCSNGDTPCSPIGPDICGSGDPRVNTTYPCIGLCDNEAPTNCPIQKTGSPCGHTNPGNLTFGGFADATWSGNGNSGIGISKGTDASFIFSLGPAEPELFRARKDCSGPPHLPYTCLWVNPTIWPQWGRGPDLSMGENGPPGHRGMCAQETYIGSGELCGGPTSYQNVMAGWGETNLEVWRLVDPPPGPPPTPPPPPPPPTPKPTPPTPQTPHCPPAEAACAADQNCHAIGVYGNNYQLHGCAYGLLPNGDWTVYVFSNTSGWQAIARHTNVDESQCKVHPTVAISGSCSHPTPR